jgi:DNA-binding MarR family transcriptional regulator
MDVLHKCNTKRCVNPEHLYIGTQRENARDALSNGGQRYGKRKLTSSEVHEIRRIYDEGKLSQREIADKFGVHQITISKIVTGRTWDWI